MRGLRYIKDRVCAVPRALTVSKQSKNQVFRPSFLAGATKVVDFASIGTCAMRSLYALLLLAMSGILFSTSDARCRASCPGRCAAYAIMKRGKLISKCNCGYGNRFRVCPKDFKKPQVPPSCRTTCPGECALSRSPQNSFATCACKTETFRVCSEPQKPACRDTCPGACALSRTREKPSGTCACKNETFDLCGAV